jgi:hypothetical protein
MIHKKWWIGSPVVHYWSGLSGQLFFPLTCLGLLQPLSYVTIRGTVAEGHPELSLLVPIEQTVCFLFYFPWSGSTQLEAHYHWRTVITYHAELLDGAWGKAGWTLSILPFYLALVASLYFLSFISVHCIGPVEGTGARIVNTTILCFSLLSSLPCTG